jgi:uncharacterized repeat protein (TIGR03803 family)
MTTISFLVSVGLLVLCGTTALPAQTLTVLHTFTNGTDGAYPSAGLIKDSEGNLYGTSFGDVNLTNGAVFKISTSHDFTILHTFAGGTQDGANPRAPLLLDPQNNLYGTTNLDGKYGFGDVFKVTATGTERPFYSFSGSMEGANPSTGLTWGTNGDLYGTTADTAFELNSAGDETIVYLFSERGDAGWSPSSRLVRNAQGNFYGTTLYGGPYSCSLGFGCGTVFELTPTGTVTVIYSFTGAADGGNPEGGLILDAAGNIYGVAAGGSTSCRGGCGVVFKLTPAGEETVLYSFKGGTDGDGPDGVLLRDSKGNFYGTTGAGGAHAQGTIFELTPSGKEKVLYSFTGGDDGSVPEGGVVEDSQGNFYGLARDGGASLYGTIFEFTP